ncbi:MAG: pilus assembly protein TadG-related protein [Oricola sp.]
MAMRLDFSRIRCGNFCIAASLLSVPVIMGAALSVDYGRIQSAREAASTALDTAMISSFRPDGNLDTALARELYTSSLVLPQSQTSTSPAFWHRPDGTWTAVVTTTTRLTFGGTLLPKTYNATITVTAMADGEATP